MHDLIHDREAGSRILGLKLLDKSVGGISALFRTINSYLLPTPDSSIPSEDDYDSYGRWLRKDLGLPDDADWPSMS